MGRSETCENSQGRFPRKIHKAEREKLKREHLNDLFLELDNALESGRHSNGKASILIDAARLLRDMLSQVESLRQENAALVSESQLVAMEKDELKEEKLALERDIHRLRDEAAGAVAAAAAAEAPIRQAQPFYIVPVNLEMQSAPVRKPRARYPSSADSWPEKILSGGIAAGDQMA